MMLDELLKDKAVKAKEKASIISNWLLDGSLHTDELLSTAEKLKDGDKANCIEALEYATKQNPGIANDRVFAFVTNALTEKAPRIKWESAKVIGNIARLFPENLEKAIVNLLSNAEHEGTVVRWSVAYALGEILKLKARHTAELLPAIENLSEKEEKKSIKKIYLDAIKKTGK